MAHATKAKTGDSIFTDAFSSYSVDDIRQAKEFYGETLGLDVRKEEEGLAIELPGNQTLFLYPKADHESASFTVLNLHVDDIAEAAEDLAGRGIEFESYDDPLKTDENGIYWGKEEKQGPNIAWFTDPAGNILSIIEE